MSALPEASEVDGGRGAAASAMDHDGDATATSTSTAAGRTKAIACSAKPWSVAFDGTVPPATNALAAAKSRYQLDPPGFDTAIAKEALAGHPPDFTRRRDPEQLQRRQQALWAQATAPAKSVALMAFMLYMMGNSLQIFSIIMTLSGLMAPLSAIWASGAAFPRDPDGKLRPFFPRAVYCLVHAAQLGFVLQKLSAMGLLPTEPSDWLSWAPAPVPAHVAGGAL